jgi:hypothetical protein
MSVRPDPLELQFLEKITLKRVQVESAQIKLEFDRGVSIVVDSGLLVTTDKEDQVWGATDQVWGASASHSTDLLESFVGRKVTGYRVVFGNSIRLKFGKTDGITIVVINSAVHSYTILHRHRETERSWVV